MRGMSGQADLVLAHRARTECARLGEGVSWENDCLSSQWVGWVRTVRAVKTALGASPW